VRIWKEEKLKKKLTGTTGMRFRGKGLQGEDANSEEKEIRRPGRAVGGIWGERGLLKKGFNESRRGVGAKREQKKER